LSIRSEKIASGYPPLILSVSVSLTVKDGTEMIGGKLHLNIIFRQLERTEHDTCIVSAEEKNFTELDSVR
jgi:hypothetical protein